VTELDKLAPAVVKLQSLLSPVDKSADNPFFKSKYAPLPEVRAALQPLLASCDLALVTMPTIIDGHNGLHFYLFHASGQYLDGQWMLTPAQRTPQGEGADTTYKQRFGIMAITGLVADEDDDGAQASKGPVTTSYTAKVGRPKAKVDSRLDLAKAKLREAIKSSGAKGDAYAWVAKATDADAEKIEGLASALELGQVVEDSTKTIAS
jgi:hypothetical protein